MALQDEPGLIGYECPSLPVRDQRVLARTHTAQGTVTTLTALHQARLHRHRPVVASKGFTLEQPKRIKSV
jgi:hypothetical protein